jgi:hypothetical protein
MLPHTKTISPEAIKRGKELIAGAKHMTGEAFEQLVAAYVKDYFGLAIYMPQMLPTPPHLYTEFSKLPYKERQERNDPHALQCRGYEWQKRHIEQSNSSSVNALKSWLIPALERMGMTEDVAQCKQILLEHEGHGKDELSWEELEARYKGFR